MTTAAAAQPAFVSPVNDTEIVMLRQWCGEVSTDQHKYYYYEISGLLYRQGFAAYALPQLARIAASRLSQVFPRVVMDEIVDTSLMVRAGCSLVRTGSRGIRMQVMLYYLLIQGIFTPDALNPIIGLGVNTAKCSSSDSMWNF